MTDLPPFPINAETIAALRHALDTSISFDDDGERIKVGGEFTILELLEFYSGTDESRSTLIQDGAIPIYEMWDQQYSITDVIRALLDYIDTQSIPMVE